MSKYELAVFDVDGTVLDTTEGVLSAVEYTMEHFKLKKPTYENLKKFIGPPIQDSFAKAYGLKGDILQEIAGVFRNKYKTEEFLLKAEPYEGIYEVFERLSKMNVRTAVATYKRHDYAVSLLCHFGFDRYTDIMYGGDHENKLKKKDIIEKCIADSGVKDKSKILMIGDTDNDAVGAQLIGVDFAAVTYGFGFRSMNDLKNLNCVGCVNSPIELLNFFE